MRYKVEMLASCATLAGLLVFTFLYHTGMIEIHREARDQHITSIMDDMGEFAHSHLSQEFEGNSDYDFLSLLGYLDENADVPEIFKEDVEMFQSGNVPRKVRSNIPSIVRCIKNAACKGRAVKTWKSWGQYFKAYCEKHSALLMHPVITAISKENDNTNGLGACTAKDDLWDCEGTSSDDDDLPGAERALPVETYISTHNVDPWATITNHTAVLNQINTLESTRLNETLDHLDVADPAASHNVFNFGTGVRLVLIIPNGVPLSMLDDYSTTYKNYWNFFVQFNIKYMGISKAQKNKNDFSFWFIRQDLYPKVVMKSFSKANKRFPWERFKILMQKPQNNVVQPRLTDTFKLIMTQVQKANYISDTEEGNDCIILWFHQYIPQDILEIAKTENQEYYIGKLDEICTIIHFWVGFEQVAGDTQSMLVVKYLQGLLQPAQRLKTSKDWELRNWFYVNHLHDLSEGSTSANILLKQVYNSIALERRRTKCLLATGAKQAPLAIAGFKAENLASLYGKYGTDDADETGREADYYYDTEPFTTLAPQTTANSAMWNYADINYEYYDSFKEYNATDTAVVESEIDVIEEVDMACCGIGLGARAYNTKTHECCPSGDIKLVDENACIAM